MNILQLLGTIIYAVSLASGIILGSADEGLNLKIAVSLSIFAALLISVPFIQLNKKGEQ